MSLTRLRLSNLPNQVLYATLPINDQNIDVLLRLNYNEQADYWQLSISNVQDNEPILLNIPLLRGGNNKYSSNLLNQYQYKGIGSIYIWKNETNVLDSPDDTTLDNVFWLIWGDNYDFVGSTSS